jgi:hypothetical protein
MDEVGDMTETAKGKLSDALDTVKSEADSLQDKLNEAKTT